MIRRFFRWYCEPYFRAAHARCRERIAVLEREVFPELYQPEPRPMLSGPKAWRSASGAVWPVKTHDHVQVWGPNQLEVARDRRETITVSSEAKRAAIDAVFKQYLQQTEREL